MENLLMSSPNHTLTKHTLAHINTKEREGIIFLFVPEKGLKDLSKRFGYCLTLE